MVATVLQGAGADVVPVGSGRSALDVLSDSARSAFDAVVIDWNLGDMPGGALLDDLLLAHPQLESRILIVTGALMSNSDEHEAAAAGFAVLTKPFRPAALRARIAELIS